MEEQRLKYLDGNANTFLTQVKDLKKHQLTLKQALRQEKNLQVKLNYFEDARALCKQYQIEIPERQTKSKASTGSKLYLNNNFKAYMDPVCQEEIERRQQLLTNARLRSPKNYPRVSKPPSNFAREFKATTRYMQQKDETNNKRDLHLEGSASATSS